MGIYNEWALEYYDSLQTGGILPPEPNIDWPDYPSNEPEFDEPDYQGSIWDVYTHYYNLINGDAIWNGMETDLISFSSQNGLSYDLDGDQYPDFIFVRYDSLNPDSSDGTYRTSLYVYSTTEFGVEEATKLPIMITSKSIPNPFKRGILIQYSIFEKSNVMIDIYTISGQLVKKIFNGPQKPGSYTVWWDGKDEKGKDMASGVYLCKIKTSTHTTTNKIILLR
jgi:hypothetical protein